MALSIPDLRRALDAAIERIEREAPFANLETMLKFLLAGRGLDWFIKAHLEGRRAARVTHGLALRAPRELSRAEAALWRDDAWKAGNNAQRLLAATIEVREPTKATLEQYARLAARQNVMLGQDAEARFVATEFEAEWKTWQRIWPRKEHRDWHDDLEGKTIPTDGKFTLPGGPNAGRKVYGPRAWDDVSDPREHMNCGHALEFKQVASREEVLRNAA